MEYLKIYTLLFLFGLAVLFTWGANIETKTMGWIILGVLVISVTLIDYFIKEKNLGNTMIELLTIHPYLTLLLSVVTFVALGVTTLPKE